MSINTSSISLIQGGLILACSLAWSDAIKAGSDYIFPGNKEKVLQAKIIYAIIITIVVLILFYLLQESRNQIIKIKEDLDRKIKEINEIQNHSTAFKTGILNVK